MNSSIGVNLNKEFKQMSKKIKIRKPNHNCCCSHEDLSDEEPIDTIFSCSRIDKNTKKIMLFSLGAFVLGYVIKCMNDRYMDY